MIIVGLISTVNSLTDLIYPSDYYDTRIYYGEMEEKSGLSKEEFEATRKKEIEMNNQNQHNSRQKRVFNSLAMVFVAFPFYIYHWKKVQQDQLNPSK